MQQWLQESITGRNRVGQYERQIIQKLIGQYNKLSVTKELDDVCISGKPYSESLQMHLRSGFLPNYCLWSLEGESDVYCGIFDSSGDRFFTAYQGAKVLIFDSSRRYLQLIEEVNIGDSMCISSVVLNKMEDMMAAYNATSNIFVVPLIGEPTRQRNIRTIEARVNSHGSSKTLCVCFDGNGTRLISSHSHGTIIITDLETATQESFLVSSRSKLDINCVTTFNMAGNVILTGSDDTNIRLFDLRALNEGCQAAFTGHLDGITYLDNKGDEIYFLSNSKDQTVKLWDIRKYKKADSIRRFNPCYFWNYLTEPIPSSYTRIYRHNTYQNSVRGDSCVCTLRGHSVRFTLIRARFSPAFTTGQRFAYAGSAHGNWFIWDLYSGEVVAHYLYSTNVVRDLCWHPFEPLIITSSFGGSLTCWSHKPGKKLPYDLVKGPSLLYTDESNQKSDSESNSGKRITVPNDDNEQTIFNQQDPLGEVFRNWLDEYGLRYRFPSCDPDFLYQLSPANYDEESLDVDEDSTSEDESSDNDSTFISRTDLLVEAGLESSEDDRDFSLPPGQDYEHLGLGPVTRSQTRITKSQSRPTELSCPYDLANSSDRLTRSYSRNNQSPSNNHKLNFK